MKKHTEFLDGVMPQVPGCLVDMALIEIKHSIIDFCERSLILQNDADPVSIVANSADYDIDVPTGYRSVKIMHAYYKDAEITPVAPDNVRKSGPGSPAGFNQPTPEEFRLYPTPDKTEANAITMRVALKPSRAKDDIDEFIFEDYYEGIVSGALHRLMSDVDKPYTNPNAALMHKVIYETAVNTARQRANRGYVRSSLQVKMRRP